MKPTTEAFHVLNLLEKILRSWRHGLWGMGSICGIGRRELRAWAMWHWTVDLGSLWRLGGSGFCWLFGKTKVPLLEVPTRFSPVLEGPHIITLKVLKNDPVAQWLYTVEDLFGFGESLCCQKLLFLDLSNFQ
ncbi:hypothetical protein AAC387_Pa01g3126 [Persea americana]